MNIWGAIKKGLSVSFKLGALAAVISVSYCQGREYERVNQPFRKEVWLLAATIKNQQNEIAESRAADIRCPMANSLVRDFLKKGMTRDEVHGLLGEATSIYSLTDAHDSFFSAAGAVTEEAYLIGFCRQATYYDPDIVYLLYDKNGVLLKFGVRNT